MGDVVYIIYSKRIYKKNNKNLALSLNNVN